MNRLQVEDENVVCPDCHFCQRCNKSRCRLCKNDASGVRTSELGIGFTYGQYMEWKKKKAGTLKMSHSSARSSEGYSLTKDFQSIDGE